MKLSWLGLLAVTLVAGLLSPHPAQADPKRGSSQQQSQQQAQQEAQHRIQQAQEEAQRRIQQAQEEAQRRVQQAQEEAQKAQQEAQRRAQQAQEEAQKAQQEAQRRAQQAQEKAQRRAQQAQQEAQKAQEEAHRRAQQAQEEAQKAQEEAHRRAQQAQEEDQRRAQQAQQEAQRRAQQAQEEAQKAQEEAHRRAQKAQEEAQKAQEEAHRRAQKAQEEAQKAQEEAHRRAQQAQEEAQRRAQQAQEEAQKAQEEAHRRAQQAQEEAQREAQQAQRNQRQGHCNNGFSRVARRCIKLEKTQLSHAAAKEVCSGQGGRLINLDKLMFSYRYIGQHMSDVRGGQFFIGGVQSFNNGLPSDRWDLGFIREIADEFKITNRGQLVSALKRFRVNPSAQELNEDSELRGQCLALDYTTHKKPIMVDCDQKMNFICEQVSSEDEEEGVWTDWFDEHPVNARGEYESFTRIVRAIAQRKLTGTVCRNPLAMECRDKDTKELFSSADSHGYRMVKACEHNQILCYHAMNGGKKCPDFEVRFKCAELPDDCSSEEVRERCERRNLQCHNGPRGAVCVRQRAQKSGNEKIGVGSCTLDSVTYSLHQCAAWGDPHYITLDNSAFDMQGACHYNLMTTCNNFKDTPAFPRLKVVVFNERRDEKDQVTRTKAFTFEVNGVKYMFTRGEFYREGMKRNYVSYQDDDISITAIPKGSRHFLVVKTGHCIEMTWDNIHTVKIKIPDIYKNHICGLCGNYDGIRENDLTIDGKPVSEVEYGTYHYEPGSNSAECKDGGVIPTVSCSDADKAKFSVPDFCGVLNPAGDSPLAQTIIQTSTSAEAKQANSDVLKQKFDSCVYDHCLQANFGDGRCRYLENIVEDMLEDLNIDDENLDRAWRQFSGCLDSDEEKCGDKPNMEFHQSFKPHCQDTCAEPDRSVECEDHRTTSGCACKEGFVMDANMNCVEEEECSTSCNYMTDNGERISIKDGETEVIQHCTQFAKCENGEVKITDQPPCSEFADCVADGFQCACRQGFKGDGRTCQVDRQCKPGYVAGGNKCRKLVRERLPWHDAALACGAEGAQLARYDVEEDSPLENFVARVPDMFLMAVSQPRLLMCRSQSRACAIPHGKVAIDARLKFARDSAQCEGKFELSANKRMLIVSTGCTAEFIVRCVEPSILTRPSNIPVWVGGSLDVLGFDKRNDEAPFQVDPQRLADKGAFAGQSGCFQAVTTNDKFSLSLKDCETPQPYICEYDNTGEVPYDPLDFIAVRDKGDKQRAIELCQARGRPVASILNRAQQDKATEIVKTLGGEPVWISLEWNEQHSGFYWQDGTDLAFSNWRGEPQPNVRDLQYYCVVITPIGFWYLKRCAERRMVLCGPPLSETPMEFTPHITVDGFNSLPSLYNKLKNHGKEKDIC
ncbi:hypothetical protein EGW08_020386, partial [Elysia chlorotica]